MSDIIAVVHTEETVEELILKSSTFILSKRNKKGDLMEERVVSEREADKWYNKNQKKGNLSVPFEWMFA